jgi:branched-chain amino acid transport system permease protein
MIRYFSWLYDVFREQILDIPGRVVALVFFILILLLPLITKEPALLRIFTFAAIFAIYAASWDLLAGFTGQVNLGHALFFGVSAYTVGLLSIHFQNLLPWLTVSAGSVVAVMVGLLAGLPALRLRGFYLGLVTLSFPVILAGLILLFHELTGGEVGLYGIRPLSNSRIINYYIINLIMIFSVLAMWKLTDARSKIIRLGLVLAAIREDEITARASGIQTIRYKLLAFAISGFFAGVAGGIYAHFMRSVGPLVLEITFSFEAILWTILGGIGTIYGSVTGVYILYLFVELLRFHPIGEQIRFVLSAIIMILILLFMPQGICVWVRDKIEIRCERCKIINLVTRHYCRSCNAPLRLERK